MEAQSIYFLKFRGNTKILCSKTTVYSQQFYQNSKESRWQRVCRFSTDRGLLLAVRAFVPSHHSLPAADLMLESASPLSCIPYPSDVDAACDIIWMKPPSASGDLRASVWGCPCFPGLDDDDAPLIPARSWREPTPTALFSGCTSTVYPRSLLLHSADKFL